VDVSDPDYIKDSVPLDRVTEVYDHHAGFEAYWQERIGDGAHIEFIGAAATLIYREWKASGLQDQMSPASARLLIAAILDNTLNLTSSNTTDEDRAVFAALCRHADVDADWRAAYFTEVQSAVEADLKNALMGDLKTLRDTDVLPPRNGSALCVGRPPYHKPSARDTDVI
jgi:nanoRNase/pAp phosphatase (c-di-AMP/oligoRNAs hydrolase)